VKELLLKNWKEIPAGGKITKAGNARNPSYTSRLNNLYFLTSK